MSRGEQHADARGGAYYMIPHVVHDSAAYRSASPKAKALLGILLRRFNGFNNGKITLSVREAAEELGSQNYTAVKGAFGELIGRGLLAMEKAPPKGSRLAREWRITFITTGSRKSKIAASNEYLQWVEGDAGARYRKKSRTEVSSTEPPVSAEETSTETQISVEETSAEVRKNGGNPSTTHSFSVEETSAHIGNHLPLPLLTAAPAPEDLRDRLRAHLRPQGKKASPGAQGRLARLAGLTDAEVSRFKHGNIDLSPAKRIRLACALPKAAADAGPVIQAKHERRPAVGGVR